MELEPHAEVSTEPFSRRKTTISIMRGIHTNSKKKARQNESFLSGVGTKLNLQVQNPYNLISLLKRIHFKRHLS